MAIILGGVKSFEGAVLETRERNYHDDSDFYALVWNDEKGAIETVEYGSTRYPMDGHGASVDATPEVRAKAAAWTRERLFERKLAAAKAEARKVKAGSVARVVKGRKLPIGEVVEVDRVTPSPFRTYYRNGCNRQDDPANLTALVRRIDGSRAWTAYTNLERVDITEPDEAKLRRSLESATEHSAVALFATLPIL